MDVIGSHIQARHVPLNIHDCDFTIQQFKEIGANPTMSGLFWHGTAFGNLFNEQPMGVSSDQLAKVATPRRHALLMIQAYDCEQHQCWELQPDFSREGTGHVITKNVFCDVVMCANGIS